MNDTHTQLNYFLVKVFNEILRIEEDRLRVGEFKNVSIREMHVIEAVCTANREGANNRASDIAKALGVSQGTLTTAVGPLERKGCIKRERDTDDKRIVRLIPTAKGKRANQNHQRFHEDMVKDVVNALSQEEQDSLMKGLVSLQEFFDRNKKED